MYQREPTEILHPGRAELEPKMDVDGPDAVRPVKDPPAGSGPRSESGRGHNRGNGHLGSVGSGSHRMVSRGGAGAAEIDAAFSTAARVVLRDNRWHSPLRSAIMGP